MYIKSSTKWKICSIISSSINKFSEEDTNAFALIVYICSNVSVSTFLKKRNQQNHNAHNKHNAHSFFLSLNFWKIHWLMGISFRIFTWMNLFWLQSGSSKQQWLCITHYTIFWLKSATLKEYLNNEKTLIIIQNSRHILFDTWRETKLTLNKLIMATYSKNPGI